MTVITEISIEYYRAFYEKCRIKFAVPDNTSGSGLTVLVGPNNSGKTTVVNALRFVSGELQQVDMEHRHAAHPFVISIENESGEKKSITNPDGGAVPTQLGTEQAFPTQDHIRIVPSRRAWSPYTSHQRMPLQSYWNNVTFSTAAEDNILVSRLADFSDDERGQFDVLLKEVLPVINRWRIELSRGQTFIQYETHSGAKHAADLFGDGMVSLFRVALSLFDSTLGQIVVIDEPELSLHPQAQKILAKVISRFAASRQILITTHSPYFVNWSDISHGAAIIRLSQQGEGVSVGKLRPETIDRLRRLIADWQKPNLLDAVSREVFFADEVVFFEGQEDVGLIRKFTEDRQLPEVEAFGYGAGGFGNIPHFLRMAQDLGIPATAVFDGDQADAKEAAEAEFPDAMIELLPTPDIRDKPVRDKQGKDTEENEKLGLFDRHGTIKPEHEPYLIDLIQRIRTFFDQREKPARAA